MGTHHHESSLSRILEVLSLNHVVPGERSASLCYTKVAYHDTVFSVVPKALSRSPPQLLLSTKGY